MSIFKTKWIILKINKINLKETLFTIFTKDYWKIICNKIHSKKEKNLDLWYIISFEISTNEKLSIHKIRNIKIYWEYNLENKNFEEINNFLLILSIVFKKTPYWTPIFELFDLIEFIIFQKNINIIKLELAKLKIISILWELNENHEDIIIKKILKFININKINTIFKLKDINNEILNKLKKIDRSQ